MMTMKVRRSQFLGALSLLLLLVSNRASAAPDDANATATKTSGDATASAGAVGGDGKSDDGGDGYGKKKSHPPNVVLFIVDDLGYNQVGYHASRTGNFEVRTPNIDEHAMRGIEMNRSYMTPWCGPSRAAMQSGRTNVYNANISNDVVSFDDDIGFAGGMPPGTRTIAEAFKEHGERVGSKYTTYFDGKWGIGGAAWTNTPLGMGYDYARTFFGDSIEPCDGRITPFTIPPFVPNFTPSKKNGAQLNHVLPAYWEQNPNLPNNTLCPYFQSRPEFELTETEKFIACKSWPRTPPKHIDEDLLDNVIGNIRNHRYAEGPMLQVFATQMMHTPIEYPSKYDVRDNIPDHVKPGAEKPPPTARDQRLTTASALRFVDDLFGETMQAFKDADQWDNTIVIFTSDNGGAINSGSVNNNYPLRSAKFSPFEGGIRIPQFLSGGWIDRELGKGLNRVSNTFMFPLDLGPTALEMAGGSSKYLFGKNQGAVYGNEMWKYIQNSLDPHKPIGSWQKPRNVSYSATLYFEVKEEATTKNLYTGNQPFPIPRHWSPNYPTNNDLLMEFGYYSVNPCRPGGPPLDCCKFDLTNDPREFFPMDVNCGELDETAKNLFVVDENGCQYDGRIRKWNNNMCIPPNNISDTNEHFARFYSLYSHYGASGPFVNSNGQPITPSMKCICWAINEGLLPAEVGYYTPGVLNLGECFKDSPEQGIECEGFTFTPQGGATQSLVAQGYDGVAYEKAAKLTQAGAAFATLKETMINLFSFANRSGYTEWPNVSKMPYSALGLDTCHQKGIAPVPWPTVSIVPYLLGMANPTKPFSDSGQGLCQLYNGPVSFCPSIDNAEMHAIKEWDYSFDDPSQARGILADGAGTMDAFSTTNCSLRCPITADGTAYIGGPETLPLGTKTKYFPPKPTPPPVSPPTPSPTPSCADVKEKCEYRSDCCKGLICKRGKCKRDGGMMMMSRGRK